MRKNRDVLFNALRNICVCRKRFLPTVDLPWTEIRPRDVFIGKNGCGFVRKVHV